MDALAVAAMAVDIVDWDEAHSIFGHPDEWDMAVTWVAYLTVGGDVLCRPRSATVASWGIRF